VAGHRLSTGAMEAVLASHPAVAECAVIGVADEIKGQIPRGFVVLQEGTSAEGLAWIFREARRDTALELAKVPVLQGMMRLVESP